MFGGYLADNNNMNNADNFWRAECR